MPDSSPDPIRFRCPTCKATVEAPPSKAGKRARCPCGQKILVPAPPAVLNKTVLGELLPSGQGDANWFLPPEQPPAMPPPLPIPAPVVAMPPELPFVPPPPVYDSFPAELTRPMPDLVRRRDEPHKAGYICAQLALILAGLSFVAFAALFGIAAVVLGVVAVGLDRRTRLKATFAIIIGIVATIIGANNIRRAAQEPVYFYYYRY
jgi:DNA-directed RNA polymerase subunit RPC12/RpoP